MYCITIPQTVRLRCLLEKTADTATENKWTLRFDNCTISFKLDTGSDVSIISEQQYQCIKPAPKLEESSTVMTSYSDDIIQ